MAHKVITAVATEPVTLAQAKAHLNVIGTGDDALITALITSAREAAEAACGRALAPQTLEMALVAFPGTDGAIALEKGPVATISSVKYTDTAGVEQTITSTAYALSLYGFSNKIAPTYGNYWPTAQDIPDAVRIRYVTGYVTCPEAARSWILLQIGAMYEHREAATVGQVYALPFADRLLDGIKAWHK